MVKTTYYQKLKRADRIKPNEKLTLYFDLIYAFGVNKNPSETANFLQDLLTANEITNLAVRLRIAKLILAGKSYEEIHKETRASSTTINKVSIWLQNKGDGLRKTISKLPVKFKPPIKFPKGPIEFHLPELISFSAQYSIASKQNKMTQKFSENIERKRQIDKQLKEESNEFYISKKVK